MIREAQLIDKPWIDENYKKFFSNNEYPDFFNDGFLSPFVVTDSSDIIVAGGIRPLIEVVVVTNKDKYVRTRLNALLQALGSSIAIARDMGHKQLHVFVHNDDEYVKILQKFNFQLIDAKLLVLNLGEHIW